MKPIIKILILSLILTTHVYAAVKVVECEDIEGNKSFQKSCPPGFSQVNEKKINTGGSKDKIEYTSNFKVKKSATLYVIPDCDTCEEVREFLRDNEVSITEIDVSNDYNLQTELEEIAGSLRVPVTIIDEKIIHGYKRSEFNAALDSSANITNEKKPNEKIKE